MIEIWKEMEQIDKVKREEIEIEEKYEVYMERKKSDIEVMEREERMIIKQGIDFDEI